MESIAEQIVVSFGIMLLGMSLVFFFLMLLILVIKLVAWKFAPLPAPPLSVVKKRVEVQGMDVDLKIVAAISVAIEKYRTEV